MLYLCHGLTIKKQKMEVNDLERMIREKEGSMSLAFPALMRKSICMDDIGPRFDGCHCFWGSLFTTIDGCYLQ
jgi:hypothetical protein